MEDFRRILININKELEKLHSYIEKLESENSDLKKQLIFVSNQLVESQCKYDNLLKSNCQCSDLIQDKSKEIEPNYNSMSYEIISDNNAIPYNKDLLIEEILKKENFFVPSSSNPRYDTQRYALITRTLRSLRSNEIKQLKDLESFTTTKLYELYGLSVKSVAFTVFACAHYGLFIKIDGGKKEETIATIKVIQKQYFFY